MTILVVGGAGYIGSNAVDALIAQGYETVVVDNLVTGFREAVHKEARFYKGDIRDKSFLCSVFQKEDIEAVMHFAALSLGRESMEQPLDYFSNNVGGTQVLLEVMEEFSVKNIVFSSSATVYGNTERVPVKETSALAPINPYGETKRMMETMMDWQSKAKGLRFIALRYFNVAGAKKNGTLGEVRQRLIPMILQKALKDEAMLLFGDDYDTPDGTCIRDFIHVLDLVEAHILALNYLTNGGESQILNVGSGKGCSNLEVVQAARKVTKKPIPIKVKPRVKGDSAILVASNDKIERLLNWHPAQSEIEEILTDAWRFQERYPFGYRNDR